jgi:sugar lactone lactonase YvrE
VNTVRRTPLALAAVLAALLVVLLPAGGSGTVAERERWHTKVLARVQAPGFPANVVYHPNGRVYAGTFSNPQGDSLPSIVREWSRRGDLLRSWEVPGQDLAASHGVQVANVDSRGRLIVLEKSTGKVLRLDLDKGRWSTYSRLRDLPACPLGMPGDGCTPNLRDAGPIPNYAAWGPDGALYLTDYGQAVLWKVPAGGGRARVWFTDKRLDGIELGTAGLVIGPERKALFVMQQTSLGLGDLAVAQGKLYRIPLRGDRTLAKLWTSRPMDLPDGFSFARSGRIYVANAGSNQLVVLDEDFSEIERVPALPSTGDNGSPIPFDTPSNVTFAGRSVLVANQSFLGMTNNHAILDVYVGERGVPVFIPRSAGVRR